MLRFAEPARAWVEAFPVGNGRLGAMVFGGVSGARVQVNDATAWSGHPAGPREALARVLERGAGPGTLARLRDAVAHGRHDEAAALAREFQGPYAQAFQPFVDLVVDLRLTGPHETSRPSVRVDEQVDERADERADEQERRPRSAGRRLDLRDGVVGEVVEGGGRGVEVEWFASAPDGCLHGRWRADGGAFGWGVLLAGAHPGEVAATPEGVLGACVSVELPYDVPPAHEPDLPARTDHGPHASLVGAATLRVATDGRATAVGAHVRVDGATWVELVLATATTSRWPDAGPLREPAEAFADATARADAALPSSLAEGEAARAAHVADHRALADATRLEIAPPLDLLLPDALTPGAEAPLAARTQAAFAYGRYLLMAASRPGAPPVNLQGIWNDEHRPAWSSGYTLNVNLEMAYWPAEVTGLGSCVEPLVDLVRVLAREGEPVARELYGCDGWVAHHNSDVWGWALPVGRGQGDPAWAAWWMGGVWLCRHLWDRYTFTLDPDVLRDVWPLLRGAGAFALDWLVPDGAGGLVPSPSSSPENERVVDGRLVALCAGSAADVALVRDLLRACVEAADVLALDEPLAPRWRHALGRLPRASVGPDGLLREWPDDAPARDPHHRHLSHLVGLYPLGELLADAAAPQERPSSGPAAPGTGRDLAEAARASLDARGPGSTGWSMAWKAALRARLGDGRAVDEVLGDALRLARQDLPSGEGGGLLPNLFSTHPPFQIDGNLGLVAAVAEALVASTRSSLRLLPALPPSWPDGAVVGLRARGALVVDVQWARGRLVEATLHPGRDEVRVVRYGSLVRRVVLRAGRPLRLGDRLVDRQVDRAG
ncbi:MAG: glycoside hydrolase family 95 protein [Cellulomonas sp.]|uniref:glycosyl hydrolase family 95 catalytic domain-containing protein n=1 Tax=Cellulomonas sp. A375-1 TaxID=1672219 RepID=UPI000B159870|nr:MULTISPECIES: glycoside hydrolase N-terminal domain-containing protein [unclassified Cellulomonas]MCR6646707.1 glycoside hydrolase family 95 protein [Cellulomonas sp.]